MSLARKVGMYIGKYATLLAGGGIVYSGIYSGITQSKSALEALLTVAAGVGVAAIGQARFRTNSRKIDYSQPEFFSERIRQTGYDRELDEFPSKFVRLVTLDVSDLTEKQTNRAIIDLVKVTSDFDLCKLVQVVGFYNEGKKYLAIGGECHYAWQGSTKKSMQRKVERIIGDRPIKFVDAHILMPSQRINQLI